MACTPAEIDEKSRWERMVCSERIVFFRGPDRKTAGLEDCARTAARRCRWAGWSRASWSAATTGWRWL